MAEKKESRKVRYTKMVIRDSLLELMQTYPINKITVKMISEQADVNRGTFYAYYHDAYDLLEATENELYDAIFASITEYVSDDYKMMMLHIFAEMEKNHELCRVLFSENGDKAFLKRILYIAHDQTIEEWQRTFTGITLSMFELAYNYLITGSVSVLAEWIKESNGMSPEQLVTFLTSFWYNGINAFNKM